MLDPISSSHLIRQLRDKSDLTQEELAKKIGKSRLTVIRYESGENLIQLDNKKLTKLLDKYQIAYPKKEQKKNAETFTKQELSDIAFMKLYKRIEEPDNKKKLYSFMKDLIYDEINEALAVIEGISEPD